MAQIGCYVPAAKAALPVFDALVSQMGTHDDMESNLSSFSMEMVGVVRILQSNFKAPLVLVDEIGRGTSNIDGMAHHPFMGNILPLRRDIFSCGGL